MHKTSGRTEMYYNPLRRKYQGDLTFDCLFESKEHAEAHAAANDITSDQYQTITIIEHKLR